MYHLRFTHVYYRQLTTREGSPTLDNNHKATQPLNEMYK